MNKQNNLFFFKFIFNKTKMSDEEKIKVIFEKYDTDKNGVLDRGEFKVVFKQLLHEMGENIPKGKKKKKRKIILTHILFH